MQGWVPTELTIRLAAFLAVFGGMALFELASPRLERPEMTGALKSRRWFTNLSMGLVSSLVLRLIFPAAAFERSGISLIQPGTGSPVLLNVEGDQVRLPVDTVEELIGSALAEITLQWWFSSDTDLICCFSYEPAGWEKHHYFLDCLYPLFWNGYCGGWDYSLRLANFFGGSQRV